MKQPFLTDPDNQSDDVQDRPKKVKGNRSIRYKEAVCDALTCIGVPLRTAEVAVIDYRGLIITGFYDKASPHEVAATMLNLVEHLYKNKDGTWHYL